MSAHERLDRAEKNLVAANAYLEECLAAFDASPDLDTQFRYAMLTVFALKDDREAAQRFRDARLEAMHEDWDRMKTEGVA